MLQTLDYPHILRALAEGSPLAMLDRLEMDRDAGVARGIKAVSMAEPFFQGHFPGSPIMPGVLQIGAMVQAASLLASGGTETNLHLVSLERAKFRKPVLPGALLRVEVKSTGTEESGALAFEGETVIDEGTACSVRFALAPQAAGVAPTCEMPAGEPFARLDVAGVSAVIPHRFPFLLLDGTNRYDDVAVGYKNVSGNDALLAGSRDGMFFEYLQVEAAAQAACVEALSLPESRDKLGYFMSIDKADFYRRVKPGERLDLLVDFELRGRFGSGEATGRVGDDTAFTAAMKFVLVPRQPEQA